MGITVNDYYNVEDVHTSEKDKSGFDYLKKSIDYYISYLVREKKRIKKARNLYDGFRDKEEFRYLEETFGIETPIAVKMTPLIKTRIDVLLGLLLDDVFTYRVGINDAPTIANIEEQKKKERAERVIQGYRKQLNSNVAKVKKGEQPTTNVVTDKYLQNIEKSINEEFISQFEIAAQSLINFFEQDLTIDLKQKIKQFFLDLLISGEAYYRTTVPRIGEDPVLEIVKPENLFFSKNTSHQFLSQGHKANVNAVVHRTYLKRSEILTQYGHLMNQETLDSLFGHTTGDGAHRLYDARKLDHIYRNEEYYDSGRIHNQHSNSNLDTLPVYHVEWLANNKVELTDPEYKQDIETVLPIRSRKEYEENYGKKAGDGTTKKYGYRLDRYEGIRIGEDIYLNCGKSKHIPRSIGSPWTTTLSYNGVVYNDRNGKPYSVALSLKDLQDTYDILNFFRDNLIANAGVDGSRINLAAIPKVLGQDYMERILKFMAFRKQGVELYDPTEDGAHLFNHYGDFRGSLSGNIIEQLEVAKEGIERQVDIVTGVNRHMYAAAEVRDAVSNVQQGQKQVSLITKDIFELVHTSRKHMLTDLINRAKLTYKKGKRGSYIVGYRTMLFNIAPENFCWTDYNINVINSTKENIKLEKLAAIVPELVGSGLLDPGVLVKITMSDSPREILRVVEESMLAKSEENDQLGQLTQQLEQMQGQIKEYEQAIEQAGKQVEAMEKASNDLKVRELDTKDRDIDTKNDLAKDRLLLDQRIAEEEISKDKMIVQLEREQLYAEGSSGNAKEVRNDI